MKALTINIIANLLAIMILISLFFRVRSLTRSSHERQLFYLFLGTDLLCCLIAPFSNTGFFFLGSFNVHFLLLVNTFLYFGDLVIGMTWTIILSIYYDHKYDFDSLALPCVTTITGVVLLLANIFTPFLFEINNALVYSRLNGFDLFISLFLVYIIWVIVFYMDLSQRLANIDFKAKLLIALPIIIGMGFQAIFLQYPVVWAFGSLAMFIQIKHMEDLKNDKDPVTNFYNDNYLQRHHNYSGKNVTLYTLTNKENILNTYGQDIFNEELKIAALNFYHMLPHRGLFYIINDHFIFISAKAVNPKQLKQISSKLIFTQESFKISSANELETHISS